MTTPATERLAPSPFSSGNARDRIAWAVVFGVLAGAILYVLWPLRETYRGYHDYRWVYVSGRVWLQGHSPYDFPPWAEEWQRIPHPFFPEPPSQPFLYPPHWALLAVLTGPLPLAVANRFWDTCNVLAFIGICAFTVELVRPYVARPYERIGLFVLLALAVLNGSLRYSFVEAQMAIVPTFGVVGAYWANRERKTGWLAFFAFVAALKPQVGTLPLLVLFLNGGHVGIAIGAGVAVAISVISLLPSGLGAFPAQLADCYRRHMAAGFNEKSTFSNLGALFSLLPRGQLLFWVSPVLATGWVAFVTWLHRRPRREGEASGERDLFVPLVLTLAFVPALLPLHGYDLVTYTPVVLATILIGPRVAAVLAIVGIELLGRLHVLERVTGITPIAPYLTLSVALLCLYAYRERLVGLVPVKAAS